MILTPFSIASVELGAEQSEDASALPPNEQSVVQMKAGCLVGIADWALPIEFFVGAEVEARCVLHRKKHLLSSLLSTLASPLSMGLKKKLRCQLTLVQ